MEEQFAVGCTLIATGESSPIGFLPEPLNQWRLEYAVNKLQRESPTNINTVLLR